MKRTFSPIWIAFAPALLLLPLFVHGQAPATPTTYLEFVQLIISIINLIIPVLFGGLFIYFMWKIIDAWIIHAGDQTKRDEGKRYLSAAIIAFVIMVSAWGILALLRQSLFG